MNNKVYAYIIIAGFFLVLIYPTVDQLFGITEVRDTEKTGKKELPKFNFGELEKSINKFDDYYSKSFGGRSAFFRLLSTAKYKTFKSSILPNEIMVGKDGYLFLGNNHGDIINETIGVSKFPKPLLRKIGKRINDYKEWLEERNIKFYCAVAPNKHSVYPEKLPFHPEPANKKLWQLQTIMKQKYNFKIIDLKEGMEAIKDSIRLFHKTDSHWNSVGGFFGYENIIREVRKDFPDIKPLKFKQLRIETVYRNTYGNSRMIDLEIEEERLITKFKGSGQKKSPKKLKKPAGTPSSYELRYVNKNKKYKVVFFRDSFGSEMVNYFKGQFKEIVFVFHPIFDKEIIIKEKPDIVIYERVERGIDVFKRF